MNNGDNMLPHRSLEKRLSMLVKDQHRSQYEHPFPLKYVPKKRSDGSFLVFPIQWHITEHCNFHCKHCYQDQLSEDLPTSDLLRIIDNIFSGLFRLRMFGTIDITGGEPFIRSDLHKLLGYLWKRYYQKGYPFVVTFLTNGSLITRSVVQMLLKYRPMIRGIQISLDGASQETHDSIRAKGSFIKALASINLLKKAGFATAIHFVITRLNKDEALSILDLAKKYQVNRVTISRFVPIGVGKQIKEEMLDPQELRDVWEKLFEKAETLVDLYLNGVNSTLLARGRCDLWHLVDPEYAFTTWHDPRVPTWLRIGQRCIIGVAGIVIMPDGTVLPCRRLPIPIGNILKQDMLEIWLGSDFLWKFRNRMRYQKGKCLKCKFMMDPRWNIMCYGGAPCISYAVHGDCFVPDPQCWYNPEVT